jgi:two-component system sensor kinase FixL
MTAKKAMPPGSGDDFPEGVPRRERASADGTQRPARVWLVDPCNPDAPSFRAPVESTRPGYPGACALNLEVPMSPGQAQDMRDALASDGPVSYTLGTKRPVCEESAGQFGVQAQMLMAVYPKKREPWLFGMHQCSYPRLWTEDERRLFKQIGRRVGDALGTALVFRDLQEIEQRYRDLMERMVDVVFTADPRGNITYASPAAERVFLVKPAEMIGRHFAEILAEADRARQSQLFADVVAGKDIGVIDAEAVRNDGAQLFVEVNASPILEEGRITGVQAIVRDVTERRRAEERVRHMEARLAHVSRLSAIGEMVAGIAHEVGQPFYSVINFAKAISNSLAREADPDLKTLQEWNEGIALAAARGAAIIRRLRDFSRRTRWQRSLIGVSQVVRESVELLSFETRQCRIALRLELLEDAPPVFVDRIQIQQVVVNLLRNAYDALRGTAEGSPRRVTIRTEMAGKFVEVAVADNGPGLPPRDQLQIFDAFVTTKPDGSGMGLAISRTIVEAHGGRLWATSNADRGSTFHMTLPVAAAGQSDHEVQKPT